jgi:predicted GNAT family N-acyltransferase
MLSIRSCSRLEFISNLTNLKEDSFAKTFVSKCDLINAWDDCLGIFSDDNELMGAIVTTYSKNRKVANLQLLHTFYKFRGNKIASMLCTNAIKHSYGVVDYFRVSADKPAHGFYENIGFKYIGEQKSGSRLSMFRLTSPNLKENNFEPDSFIWKQVNRNGKGKCVKLFMTYKERDLYSIE